MVTGEPSWEPSARTPSRARRTRTDRPTAITTPACGPVRTTLNSLTGIYGSEGWRFESLRARPGQQPLPILRRSSRLAGLDQEAAGVGDERSAGLNPLVQGLQLAVVLLDGEVRDKPDHLAQEIDHRADIEELHP